MSKATIVFLNALILIRQVHDANPAQASPSSNNFSRKCLLNDDSARRKCVYIVACCLYARLQFMIYHVSSLGFDFHIPVDFGLNVLFPHNFSVLPRNSIETSWFSLVIHESPLTEEKSMPSSLDTRISMLTPPVSRRAHLRSQKKTVRVRGF